MKIMSKVSFTIGLILSLACSGNANNYFELKEGEIVIFRDSSVTTNFKKTYMSEYNPDNVIDDDYPFHHKETHYFENNELKIPFRFKFGGNNVYTEKYGYKCWLSFIHPEYEEEFGEIYLGMGYADRLTHKRAARAFEEAKKALEQVGISDQSTAFQYLWYSVSGESRTENLAIKIFFKKKKGLYNLKIASPSDFPSGYIKMKENLYLVLYKENNTADLPYYKTEIYRNEKQRAINVWNMGAENIQIEKVTLDDRLIRRGVYAIYDKDVDITPYKEDAYEPDNGKIELNFPDYLDNFFEYYDVKIKIKDGPELTLSLRGHLSAENDENI